MVYTFLFHFVQNYYTDFVLCILGDDFGYIFEHNFFYFYPFKSEIFFTKIYGECIRKCDKTFHPKNSLYEKAKNKSKIVCPFKKDKKPDKFYTFIYIFHFISYIIVTQFSPFRR